MGEGWKWVRLGEVATMNSGGTPKTTVPAYYNGNIPFLSISDITLAGKYILSTQKKITEAGLNNSSARCFPAGTLMFAMYASIGKCAITTIDTAISQAILGITPSNCLNIDYLYNILTYMQPRIVNLGQTGTQSNLSKAIVQQIFIPLPPLDEQRRIAGILGSVDAAVDSAEARVEKLRQMRAAAREKLLTPPSAE